MNACERISALLCLLTALASAGPNDTVWTPLFNGTDLKDWEVKITGHPLNWDSLQTFRVAPCVNDPGNCLELNYSNYTNWNGTPWSHIGYKPRTFTHYLVRAEYQLFGTQTPGTPTYSMQQSALLLHSQTMASHGLDQDWSIALELQIVGPSNGVKAVGTANVCTDGIGYHNAAGTLVADHCTNATANPMTLAPTWTSVSALVLGDSVIKYFASGQNVLTYYKPVQRSDGSVKNNTLPIVAGTPVTGGTIGIQGEGAPIRFRKLEVADLAGCMDPASANYKSYYVKNDPAACNVTSLAHGGPPSGTFAFRSEGNTLSLTLTGAFTASLRNLQGKRIWEARGQGPARYALPRHTGLCFLTVEQAHQGFTRKLILGP
ncbi:MAG: DUF1080 domain-containing protein [Fibrobacteres bacterium]|jgi:hypothetical protein|nr:DUF1080 domain-containing protein [Fibrobacterota bacterium]